MKIVSWNINGYRSITGQNPSRRFDTVSNDNKLFNYIYDYQPDVVCLQETKANPEQIDRDKLQPEGYYSYYNYSRARAGYSGVVTFTKFKPEKVVYDFGSEKFDIEGRIVLTDFKDFVLLNIYFPNGTSGDHRVDYKLEFYDYIYSYLKKLLEQDRKIIVCGDYNTAHKEIDLARPKENENTSGFLPIERVKLDELVQMNFVDGFRKFNSEGGHYTWWSQRAQARPRNIGWRIDYHFYSDNLSSLVKSVYHQPDIMGSDHCPVVLEIN